MKKLILFALVFAAQGAFAKTFSVKCQRPAGFAGVAITITGKMDIGAQMQTGAYETSGVLTVTMGTNVLKNVTVQGMFDEANGFANVGFQSNPDLDSIYMNFKDQANDSVSFLERKNGQTEPLSCQAR